EPFSQPLITGAALQAGYIAEHRVPEESVLVGRQIAKMGLPADAHALRVHRSEGYLVATGGMRLRRGDVLVVMADAEAHRTLGSELGLQLLDGPAAVCAYPPDTKGSPAGQDARPDEASAGTRPAHDG
ncbi:MAG TPA: TrkA C-terminal domain-containing protein, partial [Thermoleophilia bacterium]|nr:TrkA C-terminal domain-containing protein [Thermoleophilia bacterium]